MVAVAVVNKCSRKTLLGNGHGGRVARPKKKWRIFVINDMCINGKTGDSRDLTTALSLWTWRAGPCMRRRGVNYRWNPPAPPLPPAQALQLGEGHQQGQRSGSGSCQSTEGHLNDMGGECQRRRFLMGTEIPTLGCFAAFLASTC